MPPFTSVGRILENTGFVKPIVSAPREYSVNEDLLRALYVQDTELDAFGRGRVLGADKVSSLGTLSYVSCRRSE